MKKIFTQCLLSGIVAMLLPACATTRQAVHMPDQTKRLEDPAKARIYVLRPTSFGGAVASEIRDGQTLIGNTGPRSFLSWERPAGTAELSAKTETTDHLTVPVVAGNVYYVRQSILPGIFYARSDIQVMDPTEGQALLKKCHGATSQ